jgi:hypothetical protein
MVVDLSDDGGSMSENERQLAMCLSGCGDRAEWCLW